MRHLRCFRSGDLLPRNFFVYASKLFEPLGRDLVTGDVHDRIPRNALASHRPGIVPLMVRLRTLALSVI